MNVTWSSRHASESRSPPFEVNITSLLPLLRDQAHSVVTIRHVMDKISDIVSILNPSQIPGIAADQPIYPNKFNGTGHNIIVKTSLLCLECCVLRWQHLNQSFTMKESDWTGALVESGVTKPGAAESFYPLPVLLEHGKYTR